MKRKAEEKRQEEQAEAAAAELCKVGNRCEVCVPNQPKRRATVMYVGKYRNVNLLELTFAQHRAYILVYVNIF